MPRRLKIFVTADPLIPVPPRLYGGIERVIALLVDGLVERGHEVTLFAHAESRVDGTFVSYSSTEGSGWSAVRHAATIAREVLRGRPDVVQSFGRLAYLLPVLPMALPKVMSYQRYVTPAAIRRAEALARGSLSFTGCSHSLVEPVAGTGQWTVIYNAVSMSDYAPTPTVTSDAPLVFLGRVEHIKGTHIAIEVARRTGRKLIIAGNVPDADLHQAYFREQIEPHVDGDRISYIGPVDDAAKNALLGRAACLLMPVLWDEPFGIVMAEALACGTPVVGFRRGAVPEVVRHGTTGWVCDDTAGMVDGVSRIETFDRQACRRDAEERFSQHALVDAYEKLFLRVASRGAGRQPAA